MNTNFLDADYAGNFAVEKGAIWEESFLNLTGTENGVKLGEQLWRGSIVGSAVIICYLVGRSNGFVL
jgi:hypothetical protein